MEISQRKCAHVACKCPVAGEALFCSPHCERRADEGDTTCECGHRDCETSIAEPAVALEGAALA